MGREKKKKEKKRRRSGSSSSSSDDERKVRKLEKKLKKEQRRKEKALKKKVKAEKKKLAEKSQPRKVAEVVEDSLDNEIAADIPVSLMEKSKAMAPMTKEEWDKRQSVIRKVYDEDSGRYRLIKGDGEVIESIVSREVHKKINQQSTQADGDYFQKHTVAEKNP